MKEIPLTQGFVTVVDDDIYEELSRFRWCVRSSRGGQYAVRNAPRTSASREMIYMHRVIAQATKGFQVDHINGDPLDNRRDNLRVCTHAENQQNSPRRKKNTSGYKGVVWNRAAKKWQAGIRANGNYTYLGLFTNLVDAACAYDRAAINMHGVFARLNFPKARVDG